MKLSKLYCAISGAFVLTTVPSYSYASKCGNEYDEKKVPNLLCENCDSVHSLDIASNALLFLRTDATVIINDSLNTNLSEGNNIGVAGDVASFSGWKNGQTIVLTNGSSYQTYQFNAFRGSAAFQPVLPGGEGIGPGSPINHNGSGELCKDKNKQALLDAIFNHALFPANSLMGQGLIGMDYAQLVDFVLARPRLHNELKGYVFMEELEKEEENNEDEQNNEQASNQHASLGGGSGSGGYGGYGGGHSSTNFGGGASYDSYGGYGSGKSGTVTMTESNPGASGSFYGYGYGSSSFGG